MDVAVTFIWYLVVAGPQGGLVAMPSPFEKREQCIAAIEEFQKSNPPSGWSVQCLPGGAVYDYDQSSEESSPEQQ